MPVELMEARDPSPRCAIHRDVDAVIATAITVRPRFSRLRGWRTARGRRQAVVRRLDPGRLRDPRRGRTRGTQDRPAVRPPRGHQRQLLLALRRTWPATAPPLVAAWAQLRDRDRRHFGDLGAPPAPRAAGADDGLAARRAAVDARARDARVGPHRRRCRRERAARRPTGAGARCGRHSWTPDSTARKPRCGPTRHSPRESASYISPMPAPSARRRRAAGAFPRRHA